MRILTNEEIEIFWSKVEKTETCWNWRPVGGFNIKISNNKYLQINPRRQSYQLHYGNIGEGMLIKHSCDNSKCINPQHLTLQTKSEMSYNAKRPEIKTSIEKFWNNTVQTFYCWHWTGPLNKRGSPVIRLANQDKTKNVQLIEHSPRRISLELDGQFPSSKETVHPLICGNQLCVNPKHLVFGTKARFWAKVFKLGSEDGNCWIWGGAKDKDLYGTFTYYQEDGSKIKGRAHVYSYFLARGRPPFKMLLFVCHHCDHPWCVNPDHLFAGDAQDNATDRNQKGRQARGIKSGSHILNDQKVIEIRRLRSEGETCISIGKLFRVAPTTISDICNYKSWKHVK